LTVRHKSLPASSIFTQNLARCDRPMRANRKGQKTAHSLSYSSSCVKNEVDMQRKQEDSLIPTLPLTKHRQRWHDKLLIIITLPGVNIKRNNMLIKDKGSVKTYTASRHLHEKIRK